MPQLNMAQLEEDGYTVVPGFMERETCGRLRHHIDSLLPPVEAPRKDPKRWVEVLRHPIPGAVMAEVLDNPALLELARELIQPGEMRLLEQVLIRSDPRPPPHEPLGWHVDWAFFPRQYAAVPRQTYFHMVHCLNTVPPGGAAFMIVPGSHHRTYAASARMETDVDLARLKNNPIEVAGVDPATGIEVRPAEGDLLVFNPMALHSASGNATRQPRYVYFASFFDRTAVDLHSELSRTRYRDGFPPSLRDNLPPRLRSLLD